MNSGKWVSLKLFAIALRGASKKGGAIHIDDCWFGQTAMTEVADALEAYLAEQGPAQTVDPVVGNISSTDDATGHG